MGALIPALAGTPSLRHLSLGGEPLFSRLSTKIKRDIRMWTCTLYAGTWAYTHIYKKMYILTYKLNCVQTCAYEYSVCIYPTYIYACIHVYTCIHVHI